MITTLIYLRPQYAVLFKLIDKIESPNNFYSHGFKNIEKKYLPEKISLLLIHLSLLSMKFKLLENFIKTLPLIILFIIIHRFLINHTILIINK